MIIQQIAPVIAPGTGVGSVAFHLEQERAARGHDVRRFTLTEARGDWIPRGTGPWSSRLSHAVRVAWFSTAGTLLARRAVRDLPSRAVRTGAAERVTAVGPQVDSRQYYGADDILVLPNSYEADPLLVLEGFASGLPVVAIDVRGVADIVEDGSNGYVVERTPPALAAAVRALGGQDLEGLRARAQARASAQTRSWARVAGAYLEEFQTLMPGSAS